MPYHNQYDLGAVRSGAHTIPHQNANMLCNSVLSNLTQNHIIPVAMLRSKAHKSAMVNDNLHKKSVCCKRGITAVIIVPNFSYIQFSSCTYWDEIWKHFAVHGMANTVRSHGGLLLGFMCYTVWRLH